MNHKQVAHDLALALIKAQFESGDIDITDSHNLYRDILQIYLDHVQGFEDAIVNQSMHQSN